MIQREDMILREEEQRYREMDANESKGSGYVALNFAFPPKFSCQLPLAGGGTAQESGACKGSGGQIQVFCLIYYIWDM